MNTLYDYSKLEEHIFNMSTTPVLPAVEADSNESKPITTTAKNYFYPALIVISLIGAIVAMFAVTGNNGKAVAAILIILAMIFYFLEFRKINLFDYIKNLFNKKQTTTKPITS